MKKKTKIILASIVVCIIVVALGAVIKISLDRQAKKKSLAEGETAIETYLQSFQEESEEAKKEEIEGHLNSYGKVIYTNGLIWKFYKVKEKPVKEFCLGCIDPHNQDSVIWEPVDNWYKLMSFLEDWNWKS